MKMRRCEQAKAVLLKRTVSWLTKCLTYEEGLPHYEAIGTICDF